MSDQCPTCHASPTSRLSLMRSHMAQARVIREQDEHNDDADALLRGALILLREKYGTTLGLVHDIESFLGARTPGEER